eukprot:TRINITY_DN20423_c0_g1_i2.p2 TRINITY_DN20423_c0_g1~~TRINITY_DN20423_c0_g1_i2.p2  ORF type:complete len:159 (+),score=3.96 TRINITY_DN20423_c0_g1_i2:310-786(+)
MRINAAAAVANLAQGDEGAAAVTSNQGEEALVAALALTDNDDQSREALVDAMCALASHSKESAKRLVEKGALEAVAALLPGTHSSEVHVRALMAVGMLLPISVDAPSRLGSVSGALAALPGLARSTDPDVRLIAADLFTTIAKQPGLKAMLEQQLRGK